MHSDSAMICYETQQYDNGTRLPDRKYGCSFPCCVQYMDKYDAVYRYVLAKDSLRFGLGLPLFLLSIAYVLA